MGNLSVLIAVGMVVAIGCASVGTPPATTSSPASMEASPSSLINDAAIDFQRGEFDKAREKWQTALQRARALGDEAALGPCLFGLGLVYSRESDAYDEALLSLSSAVPYFQKAGNLRGEGFALLAIAQLYIQRGENDHAIETFERALIIGEKLLEEASAQESLDLLAVRAVVYLEKAQAHRRLGQFDQAVETYRLAAADFAKLDRFDMAGHALASSGDILRLNLQRSDQAIGEYIQACSSLQRAGKLAEAAWSNYGLAWSYMNAGRFHDAAITFKQLIEQAELEGDPKLIVHGHFGLGVTLELLPDFEKALFHYQVALDRLRESDWSGEPLVEPEILYQKGSIHRNLTQYEEAVENLYAAAARCREAGYALGEAGALTQLSEILFWLGDNKAAIRCLKRSLSLYGELGNIYKQVETIAALIEVGWFSREIAGDALVAYHNQALGLLKTSAGAEDEKEILATFKRNANEKNLSEEEKNKLFRQLTSKIPIEYRSAAGTLFQKVGRCLLSNEETRDGAIEMMTVAFGYHENLPLTREIVFAQAKDLYYLAQGYHLKKEFGRALQTYLLVENQAIRLRTPEVHWVYAALGRLYGDMGDIPKAVSYYEKGLAMLESIRGEQGTEEFRMGVVEGASYSYRNLVALLLDLYRKTGEESYLHESFECNERLRARVFLDMLGRTRAARLRSETDEQITKEEEIHFQIAQVHSKLRAAEPNSPEESQLLKGLENLRERWRTLQLQHGRQSPQYARILAPNLVTIEEIQLALDPDAALLEYFTGADRSFLWAITKEKVRVYKLPGKEALPQLEAFLRTVREPLMGSEEIKQHLELGQRLYCFIEPALKELKGKRHLVISPDGPLYYLPFEALIIPNTSKRRVDVGSLADAHYLLKDFAVSYVPSASVLLAQLEERKRTKTHQQFPLLAFGDPVYEDGDSTRTGDTAEAKISHVVLRDLKLTRLQFSRSEVDSIARIWDIPLDSPHINLREKATVERLRELDLSQYRILHFATHAVLGDEVAWATQPALIFTMGQTADAGGLLRFDDILRLKLNAELVTLSACNTGLGRLREGEGIVGLTRAFLYAGASSVVVSLWKVEDQSTSLLMSEFYRGLNKGESRAAALRQAKLKILNSVVDLEAVGIRQQLSAPFYWAPFILIGQ